MKKASIIIDLSEDDCIESYLSNDKYKNTPIKQEYITVEEMVFFK